ncbi:hypothetical protein EDB87DRAFT_1686502 [Lactarius vividus]|nr:hypothetical protein EDB87DRAFT_1686502 [Lactarius vividus]
MPIFRYDTPFYTPLSLPAWLVVNGVPFVIFRFLRWYTLSPNSYSQSSTCQYFKQLEDKYHQLLSQGMLKTAEETARTLPSEIDTRAFMWTFDSLKEDDELERFFAGLPSLRSSKVVRDPLPGLAPKQQLKLFEALIGLLDRTFSSDLLPDSEKHRRTTVCAKAIDPTDIPGAFEWILRKVLSADQYRGLQTTEFGNIISCWGDGRGQRDALLVRAITSIILARVQERDDRWFTLASKELGITKYVLRDYETHRDSASLAILIHITRRVHSAFAGSSPQARPQVAELMSDVLGAVSEFTAQDTSAELRHDFCALWNQIALEARSSNGLLAWFILRRIRNVYIVLHHGTDASPTDFTASTGDQDRILRHQYAYPLCRIHDRYPNLTPHIHDITPPTVLVSPIPHENSALPSAPLDSSPNIAPSTGLGLLRVDENVSDALPPDNNDTFVPGSLHATFQITLEIPALDPATTGATRQDPSLGTIPRPTLVHRYNADLRDSSGAPDFPSRFPTEKHGIIIPMPTTPLATSPTPRELMYVPHSGAIAEGESSAMAALRRGKDRLDLPLVNSAVTGATLHDPLQSPSLPPVADIAVAGPSQRTLGRARSSSSFSRPV